jgi:hypothetical protein
LTILTLDTCFSAECPWPKMIAFCAAIKNKFDSNYTRMISADQWFIRNTLTCLVLIRSD